MSSPKRHNPPPTLTCEDLWKDEVTEEFIKLLEQDCAEFFRSQKDPLADGVAAKSPCGFCESRQLSPLFRQQAYSWVRCRDCGLLQKSPRPTMEAQSQFYRKSKAVIFFEEKVLNADQEIREEKIFNPYLDRLERLVQKHSLAQGALLDIGCAGGHFLAAARKRKLLSRFAGVEASPNNAEKAKQLDFTVYPAMFEEAEIPAGSFDIITCFSMIQFIQDPVTFLHKCKQILRPGGFAIFTSPNGWAPDILLLQEFSPVLPCHTLQLPDPESFMRLCSRVGLSEVYAEAIGQLDVQLVRETWQKFPPDLSHPWADFLYRLFVQPPKNSLAADLQILLQQHNLSGHLWLQACNAPK